MKDLLENKGKMLTKYIMAEHIDWHVVKEKIFSNLKQAFSKKRKIY